MTNKVSDEMPKIIIDCSKEQNDAIKNIMTSKQKISKELLLTELFKIYVSEKSQNFQSFIRPIMEIVTKHPANRYEKLVQEFDEFAKTGKYPTNKLEFAFENFIDFFQEIYRDYKTSSKTNSATLKLLINIIEEYEKPRNTEITELSKLQEQKIKEFLASLLNNNTNKELEANQDIIIKVFQLFHDEEFWNYYWVNAPIRKKSKEEIELQINKNYENAYRNGLLAGNDTSYLPKDVQKFLFITEKMKPIYKELETELGINIDIDEITSAIDVAFMLNVNKTEDAKITLDISKNYNICPYLLLKLFYMRRDYKILGKFMQNAIYYDNFSGKLEDFKLKNASEQKYKCDLIYDYDNAYIKIYSNTKLQNVKDFLKIKFPQISQELKTRTNTFYKDSSFNSPTEILTNEKQYENASVNFIESLNVLLNRLNGVSFYDITKKLNPNLNPNVVYASLEANLRKNLSDLVRKFKENYLTEPQKKKGERKP